MDDMIVYAKHPKESTNKLGYHSLKLPKSLQSYHIKINCVAISHRKLDKACLNDNCYNIK